MSVLAVSCNLHMHTHVVLPVAICIRGRLECALGHASVSDFGMLCKTTLAVRPLGRPQKDRLPVEGLVYHQLQGKSESGKLRTRTESGR